MVAVAVGDPLEVEGFESVEPVRVDSVPGERVQRGGESTGDASDGVGVPVCVHRSVYGVCGVVGEQVEAQRRCRRCLCQARARYKLIWVSSVLASGSAIPCCP